MIGMHSKKILTFYGGYITEFFIFKIISDSFQMSKYKFLYYGKFSYKSKSYLQVNKPKKMWIGTIFRSTKINSLTQ